MKLTLRSISIAIILALSLSIAIPAKIALAATCTWNGTTSNDWSQSGNWTNCGNVIPDSTDVVVIPAGVSNFPTITSDVTLAGLQIDSGASLTIDTGGSLTMNGDSTIDGDLICDGAFTATGYRTTFSGTTNQTISGGGTTTFGTITINNTGVTNDNIVNVALSGTTYVFAADPSFLTLTQGILEFSGVYPFSNSLFSNNDYAIVPGAGIWLNNPNVTITAVPGSYTPTSPTLLQGLLHLTDGNYNVGNEVNESLVFEQGSSLIVDGGSLNVAGYFAGNPAGSPPASIQLTSGAITVGMVAGFSSDTYASFSLGGSTSVLMNGGTATIQNENTGSGHDLYVMPSVGGTVSGGTIQFGNALTNGSPSFEIASPTLPSVVIASNGNTPSVELFNYPIIVYGSVLVGANTTLNTNAYGMTVFGNFTTPPNLTNNGTLISNNIAVNGVLTNNGLLQQTRDVSGSGDVSFFSTGGYGGVILNNASGSALGTTTVTIWGNHDCTDNANETIRRCFNIEPANTTGLNSTITFFYADTEMVPGSTCDSLEVYHNSGGTNWDPALTRDPTYGTNGRLCTASPYSIRVTGASTFSPFALKTGSPTAIRLSALSVRNQTRNLAALIALTFMFVTAITSFGVFYLHKRKLS